MKTKLIKQLLLLAILLVSLPMNAFNVDGIAYDILSKEDQTAAVGGQSYNLSGIINIPPKIIYNDTTYTVTSISKKAFSFCTSLTQINIPNSVTSIGESAFYGCIYEA